MGMDDKGFGFIGPSDGSEDVFVHRKMLSDGSEWLEEGQQVEYEVTYDDRKGKYAASTCSVVGGPNSGGGGGGGYGAAPSGYGGGKGGGGYSPYGGKGGKGGKGGW